MFRKTILKYDLFDNSKKFSIKYNLEHISYNQYELDTVLNANFFEKTKISRILF